MAIITEDQLSRIFKSCKQDKIKEYVFAFNLVLPQFNIDTPRRIAAFIGQIGVESGELRYDKELPSKWNKNNPKDPKEQTGTLYEGRKSLGNTKAGDGPRYIGRGVIQLTGRANYEAYGKKLNIDLVNDPEMACIPEVSIKIACQYFKDRGLLELADKWDLEEITRRVNGPAKLHLQNRVIYSEVALRILQQGTK